MAMRCLSILLLSLTFLFTSRPYTFAQQPSVTAQVSSRVVQVGQAFVLEYTIEGDIKQYEVTRSFLKDFEVLGGPFESKFSSVVFDGNGVKQTANISVQYKLSARQAGNFIIPAVSATNSKGQVLRSNTVPIRVVEGQARPQKEEIRRAEPVELTADKLDQNLFMIAEVDKTDPYVGEQVNVTYKLYTVLQMSMSPTSKPQLNGFWAYDEELPENSEPHQENYNGRRYNVFILRKTALFPQQSGQLTVDPIKAAGWVLVKEPDLWGYYQDTRVNKEVQSRPVTINVRPLPEFEGDFSGGVGRLSIAQSLNKTEYSTDDIIQLTVSVNGTGNLGLIAAPTLVLPAGLTAIVPEVRDEVTEIMPRLTGTRQFFFNISAGSAGTYTIPEIAFSYFDDNEQRYKTLYTSPFRLTITEGKGERPVSAEGTVADQNDILPILTASPRFGNAAGWLLFEWYYWAILLIGVSVPFFWAKLRKRKQQRTDTDSDAPAANTVAERRLTAARTALQQRKDTVFFEEISKALWIYLSEQLKVPLSNLKKNTLEMALQERGIEESLIAATLRQIEACEMALYTPIQVFDQERMLMNAHDLIAKFEHYFNSGK